MLDMQSFSNNNPYNETFQQGMAVDSNILVVFLTTDPTPALTQQLGGNVPYLADKLMNVPIQQQQHQTHQGLFKPQK